MFDPINAKPDARPNTGSDSPEHFIEIGKILTSIANEAEWNSRRAMRGIFKPRNYAHIDDFREREEAREIDRNRFEELRQNLLALADFGHRIVEAGEAAHEEDS